MLTYEEALTRLLAWIDQPVNVTVVPEFEGAMQIAGMLGTLRRGEPPRGLTETTGHTGEVLFFYVGDDEDWNRSWFAITEAQFVRAFTYPSLMGGEMLVVSQRLVNIAISLLPSSETG